MYILIMLSAEKLNNIICSTDHKFLVIEFSSLLHMERDFYFNTMLSFNKLLALDLWVECRLGNDWDE